MIWWLSLFFTCLIWSGINPVDRFTWYLEVAPAVMALVALAVTRKRFPLSRFSYVLILIHCLILMYGGKYTYAENPLFYYLGDLFGWERNNYDKLGHLAQGFIPAIIFREVLVRKEIIKSMPWTNFITVCFCLAISAFYELIEWWVSVFTGEGGDAFLGTQGYIWDTQSDMLLALIGSILALIFCSKASDKSIQKVSENLTCPS